MSAVDHEPTGFLSSSAHTDSDLKSYTSPAIIVGSEELLL